MEEENISPLSQKRVKPFWRGVMLESDSLTDWTSLRTWFVALAPRSLLPSFGPPWHWGDQRRC